MKKESSLSGYAKLKNDISNNSIGLLYVFFGRESYLRAYSIDTIHKKLIPDGFDEFNYHILDGKEVTVQQIIDAAEAFPMMSERSLIVVHDYDLSKMSVDEMSMLNNFMAELPEYCCIIFSYDTIEFKAPKADSLIGKALKQYAQLIEFKESEHSDLIRWIERHFKALGKEISDEDADYLIFLCGSLMTELNCEIEKIGAYSQKKTITRHDIDAVATRTLSAEVFEISSCILDHNYDKASRILGDLLLMQKEPILILGVLSSQLRKIYSARIAIESGKDQYWLMQIWEMKSSFAGAKLISVAKTADLQWCRNALRRVEALDRQMKSQRGFDGANGLKMLLMELGSSTNVKD